MPPALRLTLDDPRSSERRPARPAPGGEVDALAELFLGPRGPEHKTRPEPVAPRQPAPGAPRVEGLIMGHLPVTASAWAMQYARQTAATGGPVGTLRIRGDELLIEVIGGPAVTRSMPATSIQAALQLATATARHWFVRIDGDETTLAEQRGLDRVTLLSGADQAAMIAVYRMVKVLFSPGATALPAVRIAIVGSSDDRAADARQTLAKAAAAFLSREVEVVTGPQRIGGGDAPATLLYCGKFPGLDEVLTALRQELAKQPAAPPGPATPAHHRSDLDRNELDRHLIRVMEQAVTEAGPRQDTPSNGSTRQHKPADEIREVKQPARAAPAALGEHLGLLPLAARCPYTPAVELAVDGKGQLHLLAQASGSDSLRSLMTAAAWATAHAELLQLVTPSMVRTQPAMHLFVEDARAIRDLHETGVHLHLLARVEVGGEVGWFCGALN